MFSSSHKTVLTETALVHTFHQIHVFHQYARTSPKDWACSPGWYRTRGALHYRLTPTRCSSDWQQAWETLLGGCRSQTNWKLWFIRCVCFSFNLNNVNFRWWVNGWILSFSFFCLLWFLLRCNSFSQNPFVWGTYSLEHNLGITLVEVVSPKSDTSVKGTVMSKMCHPNAQVS